MVRLKGQAILYFETPVHWFQFHNGSIKRKDLFMKCRHERTSFNSTMVRLKGKSTFLNLLTAFLFQFHNGSIKSQRVDDGKAISSGFQFHNGSIKRMVVSAYPILIDSFNSTMVRLKELSHFCKN